MHPVQGFIHTPPVGYYFNVTILENSKGASPNSTAKSKVGKLIEKGKPIFEKVKNGVIDSAFQEVSGLKASISPEPIISGGDTFAYQVPKGNVNFEPLLLQRGLITVKSALQEWCKECLLKGDFSLITTKDVVVTLLDPTDHIPVSAWIFREAYPIEYEISGFNAKEGQIMVEKIKLVYRYFEFAMDALEKSDPTMAKDIKNIKMGVKGTLTVKKKLKI
ncbi:MAG: phage tail protein [Raineya sp.]|jgi:phage tail-like protein|nr:phage tail protein [Raineya sp.]